MPSMRMHSAVPLAVFAAVLMGACRDEGVTRARVPKPDAAPLRAAAPAMGAPMARGLTWTMPSGWKELPGNGIRLATFTPPGGLKTEGTVVALPGDSGGELANVNRWRGQIALPPVDEAGLSAARTTLSTKAGPVAVYDFTSAGAVKTRLIAAVAKTGDTSWFFKLTGDAAATESARPGFMTILKGLTPDAAK